MIALSLLVVLVVVLATVTWQSRSSRRDGAPAGRHDSPRTGRVSLLTEAVAYLGAVLVVAGGATAVGQRWDDISAWGRVGVLAAGAALFLLAGASVRHVVEPAVQRLVSVLWSLSVAGLAAAVGVLARQVLDASGERVALATGLAVVVHAGWLWLARRAVPQLVAVFLGTVVTGVGAVAVLAGGEPPALPSALVLWALGISWAVLGWRRHFAPAVPLGVLLALYTGTIAVGEHGWFYAVAIGTAAAVMAVSVPTRNPVLLGLGTVAVFGYVTGAVVRYLGDTLGVPTALSVTGLFVLVLALVTARLLQAARPAPEPDADDAAAGELAVSGSAGPGA